MIKLWFQDHPTANNGLRTGVSFDVIDLDGEAAIDALEKARAGRERLRGPVVKTGMGYHYLVLPTGLGNRAGILPGVDFRGRGGYIVAPPSLHPDGHRYQWINPLLDDLAPAPAWLLELMTPERVVNGSNRVRVTTPSAYGRVALRRELERLSQATEGTRNHALNKAAFALGQLVAIGALDEGERGPRSLRKASYWGLASLKPNGQCSVDYAQEWNNHGASHLISSA